MKKRVVLTLFSIMIFSLFVSVIISAQEDPNLAPNPSTDVQLDVGNAAPVITITSVNSGVSVDLNPGLTQPVEIIFDVEDPNGPPGSNLDDATLTITYGFPSGGPFTETVAGTIADCATAPGPGNIRTYTCTLDMDYFSSPLSWDAVVDIDDTAIPALTGTNTLAFTVNQLLDIIITSPINFGAVAAGQQDIIIATPTTITNQGNVEVPADYNLRITGQFLGTSPPGDIISSSSFNAAGAAGAGTVCASGTTLSDATAVIIAGASLLKNPPTNTEDIIYCLDVPPVAQASYSATNGGGLWTIEIAT